MAGRRVERVARAIKEAVSEVVLRELNDPRVRRGAGYTFLTITRVEPTRDLREARVYFSVLGAEAEKRRVAVCLKHARGFIQREVGRRLPMRYCPHLTFTEDVVLKRSLEVSRLIQQTQMEQDLDAEPTGQHDTVGPGSETA